MMVGGEPRANLLPPEFAADARLRAQRRGMVFLALLSVALLAMTPMFVVGAAWLKNSVPGTCDL